MRAHVVLTSSVLALSLAAAGTSLAQVDARMFSGPDPVREAGEQRRIEEQRRWEARRNGPNARQERTASRVAFAGVQGNAAVDLAQGAFPQVLRGNLGGVRGIARGQRVAGAIDDFTARVETADGEPDGMLISTRPISVSREGERALVDLDLERRGDGYAPAVGAADVLLPGLATGAVAWSGSGIRLRLAGAGESEAVLRDDRLFYPAAAGTDADYVLMPVETGVQVMWQLRSESAPESFRMAFELAEGMRLEPVRAAGGIELLGARVVAADGTVEQTVTAPVTVDADGTAVPTAATVEGDELVVSVQHRGEDLRYPLLVDPIVQETWAAGGGFASCGASATGGSWSYTHNSAYSAYNFSCWGAGGHGLYVGQANGGYYNQGSTGYWYWQARPDSYIQSVSWNGSRHVPAYNSYGLQNYTLFYAGIWSPGCCWRAYDSWGHYAHWSWTQNASANADNTQAVLGVITNGGTGTYYEGGVSGLDGASIVVNDNYAPHNVWLESFEPALQTSTVGSSYRESQWHNMYAAPPMLSAHAEDRGLGLQKIGLNDSQNRWVLWLGLNSTCTGLKNWNCFPSYTTSQSWATNMYQLPQGVTTAYPVAADVTGKVGYGTAINLKNDFSAPVISVGGSLLDVEGHTLGTNGAFTLDASATDGSNASWSTMQSGVAELLIKVNATQVARVTGCSALQNSCSLSLPTWSFDPAAHAPDANGRWDVHVIARDRLGHESARHIHVYADTGISACSPLDPLDRPDVPCSLDRSAADVEEPIMATTAAARPLLDELATKLNRVPTDRQYLPPNPESASRFKVVDPACGCRMDALDVIENPISPPPAGRKYLGVYHHHYSGDTGYRVVLAGSDNLLDWNRIKILVDGSLSANGLGASQPTLYALADGGYLMAYEEQVKKNSDKTIDSRIRLMHYTSQANLFNAVRSTSVLLRQTAGKTRKNTGTPHFRSVQWNGSPTNSRIQLGFHYLDVRASRLQDYQARGWVKNFNAAWESVSVEEKLDGALFDKGFYGNHGDRTQFRYKGKTFRVIEAQKTQGNFATWRLVLEDPEPPRKLIVLNPQPYPYTWEGGITKPFANPAIKVLGHPSGTGSALAVASFAHSTGSTTDQFVDQAAWFIRCNTC